MLNQDIKDIPYTNTHDHKNTFGAHGLDTPYHPYQNILFYAGPIIFGTLVTVFTWRFLHPTRQSSQPVKPSLHFGKVVSILNGLLVGLYVLFYNLKIAPYNTKQ